MSNRQDHIDYIKSKGKFKIDCSRLIFNEEEIEILEKYGHWFVALTEEILNPVTDGQRQFVLVAQHRLHPVTPAETAWFKYLRRKALEEKKGESLKVQYTMEEDTFYNRKMAKQQKKMMFNEVNKIHRT
jgi:uncharacterized protein YifE (UPF0438 family)